MTDPHATLSSEEIEHFRQTAALWWDEQGPYALLHRLNPIRLGYIQKALQKHTSSPSLNILDIGCGGGLLSIPLARQGHHVTGLDACDESIQAARAYADAHQIPVTYHAMDAEAFAQQHQGPLFDVVCLMEILEHVPSPAALIHVASSLLKPGGLLFFSTINRSWLARFLTITVAESLLRWVPEGTHHADQFLRPSEVARALLHANIQPEEMVGVIYHPLKRRWIVQPHKLQVNYMGYGVKKLQ